MDNITLVVRLRYAVLILGIIFTAVVSFSFLYFQWASSPKELIPIISACVALIALCYAAMTLHLNTEIRVEELRIRKLEYAMSFIERSSMPDMATAFRICYNLRKTMGKKTTEELIQLIEDDKEVLEAMIIVLNYFERLGIIIRFSAADEQALKDYYSVPIQSIWSLFHEWIEAKRKTSGSKNLFCELEFLIHRWA